MSRMRILAAHVTGSDDLPAPRSVFPAPRHYPQTRPRYLLTFHSDRTTTHRDLEGAARDRPDRLIDPLRPDRDSSFAPCSYLRAPRGSASPPYGQASAPYDPLTLCHSFAFRPPRHLRPPADPA